MVIYNDISLHSVGLTKEVYIELTERINWFVRMKLQLAKILCYTIPSGVLSLNRSGVIQENQTFGFIKNKDLYK